MSESIKKLKIDYKIAKKSATNKLERKKIKSDYLEMKKMLKQSDKTLRSGEKGLKKIDKILSKIPKLDS